MSAADDGIMEKLGDDYIHHVHPIGGREHITNRRADCWCHPNVTYETRETAPLEHEIIGVIIIHNYEQ